MQKTKNKFNIKRLFQVLILVLCLISGSLVFGACSSDSNRYIVGIKETGLIGSSTVYTITYSDGTTSNFTIENGLDGKDISVDSIFEYCINELNLYSEYETNYEKFQAFLSDYFSIDDDTDEDLTTPCYTAIKSTVNIYSFFPLVHYAENHPSPAQNDEAEKTFSYYSLTSSAGSGVVYKMGETYSYIVTCYHVVYYYYSATEDRLASQIYLFQYGDTVKYDTSATSSDESSYPEATSSNGISATYVGGSMQYDIAVLQVNTKDLASWTQAVTIAENGYSLSDTVIAVGNPERQGISVTSGIINVCSEIITDESLDKERYDSFRVLRTDTAINSGNSGGGLFNTKGELVGIVNIKIASYDIDNMAYAIPYDNVVKVADNIIDNYEDDIAETKGVTIVSTGLSTTEENSRAVYDNNSGTLTTIADCVISAVAEGSLANSLELLENDVITKVKITTTTGETEFEITREYMFSEALLTARIGDTITITYTRGGDEYEITTDTLTINNFAIYL